MQNSRKVQTFNDRNHTKTQQKNFRRMVGLPRNFLRWFLTLVILGAVLSVSLHLSEEINFMLLLKRANPYWIIIGIILQASTYFCQSFIWSDGLKIRGHIFKPQNLFGLSLAQLFINQAVPSLSVSGAFFISKALGQRGVPRQDIYATLGLSFISYFEAYALAALITVITLYFHAVINLSATLFLASLILLFCISFLYISHKRKSFLSKISHDFYLNKFRIVKRLIHLAREMNLESLPLRLIIKATCLQLLVFALDFFTLWCMLMALGSSIDPVYVFLSYMMAYFARTLGMLPGGLGVFEAAAIASLHQAGISIGVSLAATLLYRGLSFWLPMIPGLLLVQRIFHHSKAIQAYRIERFWKMSKNDLFLKLKAFDEGLSHEEAGHRQIVHGMNFIQDGRSLSLGEIFWNQVKSPLVLILIAAALISAFVADWSDALIILIILLIGAGIGTWREYEAQSVIDKLKLQLASKTKVKRNGEFEIVLSSQLVPGDIVSLSAGDLVPADLLVLRSQDCYVNEATITGESFPVLKSVDSVLDKGNALFLGSNVQTGTAECLVVNTGVTTIYGAIAESLKKLGPQTDFDRNMSSFGYMMIKTMLVIVILVFSFHSFHLGITIESLMFSVALAVGLSPELLPLIINYDLSVSTKRLAEKGLLVRHPKAIENIAAVDILCTDKSGTITEGVVDLQGAYGENGTLSNKVLSYACMNAHFQTGMMNPLDEIIKKKVGNESLLNNKKVGEIPYDFKRKRLSVLVEEGNHWKVITKGAFQKILEVSTRNSQGEFLTKENLEALQSLYEKWSVEGSRVLGLAVRDIPIDSNLTGELESDMSFQGFLVFMDHPKKNVLETLKELNALGVQVKIISGDNVLVTKAVAGQIGLDVNKVISGEELDSINDEAFPLTTEKYDIFAQVDPHQKERIVTALRKRGHTVAYMGDGINDVSAMHASDASISVDSAVDVAKSTADFVLLEKSLEYIKQGILEGRVTFNNSLKYINITMSANLGNMISMAVASVFLPFLPLLAGQVLLNNLLSDIPSLGLAKDRVDESLLKNPTRWNLNSILRYMVSFGLISTIFDLTTFYALIHFFKTSIPEFRTAWFTESLLTELLVVIVLRTMKPFYKSRPATLLIVLTSILVIATLTMSYIPFSQDLGFMPMRRDILLFTIFITVSYLLVTEMMKNWLYQRFK